MGKVEPALALAQSGAGVSDKETLVMVRVMVLSPCRELYWSFAAFIQVDVALE